VSAGPHVDGARPAGIWLICIFYFASAGCALASSWLILFSDVTVSAGQAAYFARLSWIDYAISIGMNVLSLTAAASLFRMRRSAVTLFQAILVLNAVLWGYHITAKGWTEAASPGVVIYAVVAWVVLIGAVLYSRSLRARGFLR
jgi:hypothetical protein